MKYNMTEKIREIARLKGVSAREVATELGLSFSKTAIRKVDGKWVREEIAEESLEFGACNRREENHVLFTLKEARAEQKKAKFRSARNGNAEAYTEPFFTRNGDGWAVVARGVDFVEDEYGATVVKVRRRDGSVGVVEAINTVDRTSTEVKVWDIK